MTKIGLATAPVTGRSHKQRSTEAERQPMPGELGRSLGTKEREFLPAALELLETPPSPVRVAGIWLICSAMAATLLWSYFGMLDIHAVAQGRIQPTGRSKVIQPLEPGKIAAILVENGSRVQSGDVLIELDPTDSGADRESLTRELGSTRAEVARRKVAVAIGGEAGSGLAPNPIAFDAETGGNVRQREERVLAAEFLQLRSNRASLLAQQSEHAATRAKLVASIAARERLIALAEERVGMRTTLSERGALSRAMVIEVLSQYETLITTHVAEKGQLAETEAQYVTIARKMDEAISLFSADQMQKLAEAERRVEKLTQELVKATAKRERATLKSPITGTVQQLVATTIGQVVGSGQSLMTIVPAESPIEIEAMIQNQDIGFVEEGQSAVIKVKAFPFTRYGTIPGRVLKVSRDAVEDREAQTTADPMAGGAQLSGAVAATAPPRSQNLVFPVVVRLERSTIDIEGKAFALSPGMAVTVEILTGQRRAIDYILSPLREAASNTARER